MRSENWKVYNKGRQMLVFLYDMVAQGYKIESVNELCSVLGS